MALTSPGVEVTITDQSQYLPAPTNSVPLVVLATAQNKADASGTGVAAATTAANAGKLYQVTSQRDLVNLYGTPFFYTTTNGTPIQGYELNEYGLLAAYSLLGVTNRCYVLRANIDLASLVGQTGRPTGAPDNGTYWLDTTTSTWGIYEFNASTGEFALQNPLVITDTDLLSGGYPLNSLGNIGDYAVDALKITGAPTDPSSVTYFYKTTTNQWTRVGSVDWLNDWPTVQGTESNPGLTAGNTFTINIDGNYAVQAVVPSSPGNNTVAGLAAAINLLGLGYLYATVRSGKLCLFSAQPDTGTNHIEIIDDGGGNTVLADLGIAEGIYNIPAIVYGTSAQMPLWSASQSAPRPTGSVWIKVGTSGNGLAPVVSSYNATTASWTAKNVSLATTDWSATAALDSTGGKAIPAGSVYCQYAFGGGLYPDQEAPLYFWERLATGPTVVTGTETNFEFSGFDGGSAYLYVRISTPGSSSLSSAYGVLLNDGDGPTEFVEAWQAAQSQTTVGIPYTTATVTTDGAVQITHTEGGEIILSDYYASGSVEGTSSGILSTMGLVIGSTVGCKYGISLSQTFNAPAQGGSGTDALVAVIPTNGEYYIIGDGVPGSGQGQDYVVGDELTVLGTDLGGATPANDLVVQVMGVDGSGAITGVAYVSGTPNQDFSTCLSNWVALDYTANEGAPVQAPANNTNWFYSVVDQVDIMVNYNGQWNGYREYAYDSNGFPTPTGSNATDPAGPIVSATAPTTQSDGTTALAYGDIWIDTSDLENYPIINRWQSVANGATFTDQWVTINNTDQTSSSGVLFADARWATNGTTNPADDPIPTIASLLLSSYVDLDAPESSLYPSGMMLFNTRRSGYNVKQYRVNYFNATAFPDQSLPVQKDAWVSVSGLQSDGSPYMGRKAQRAMVVQALRSVIDTNTDIRDEDNFFNLMATPNYPELQPNMVVLNADRGETGYIIGDTPLRLADSATDIQAWATNAAGATSTGEDGLVTRNTYLGLFYPSGIAPDLSGNLVAVPASHMMLRTFLRNDTVSYPWLAAAGTRRGTIDNATNIGYVDATTGEFVTIKTRIGIRDVLYVNFINPLVFFTGVGLLNYGNKTSYNSQSALDRTNVARLIAYIRRQLTLAARPFVFEPNDALTRQQIAGVVQTLMVDLVAKRGLYDYLVVCDESNNTPARIDRNELWIDVAVEPVKAAEFIYIPVRVLNTGELAAL
jgi:hypothetical protein